MTDLTAHKKGDTWLGLGSVTVLISSTPLDLTGATIRMQIRRTREHPNYVKQWSTEDDSISILNAPAGIFAVNEGVVDVPSYVYFYDIQIETGAGRIITIVEGNWEISDDVTR